MTLDALLGRTNATVRSLTVGAQLVGVVIGGLLAVAFDTALVLLIAAVGMLLGPAWLILSPVRPWKPQHPTDTIPYWVSVEITGYCHHYERYQR